MELTGHEKKVLKLTQRLKTLYRGLDSLGEEDVENIIRRAYYLGRRAGYLECSYVVQSSYRNKFKKTKKQEDTEIKINLDEEEL